MQRTTVFLKKSQIAELAEVAAPDGLTTSALVRIFINEGLKRAAKKQAAQRATAK
jgi:hypothetical protein